MANETPVQYRLVTRYATVSSEAADENGHDDPNPIADLPAFKHFGDDHASRRDGGVVQKEATLVGAYITTIA